MRLVAIAITLSLVSCTRAQSVPGSPSAPAGRVAADTSLRLERIFPPPVRGYRLDCLTPPDSTGACVLRDQRVVPW